MRNKITHKKSTLSGMATVSEKRVQALVTNLAQEQQTVQSKCLSKNWVTSSTKFIDNKLGLPANRRLA